MSSPFPHFLLSSSTQLSEASRITLTLLLSNTHDASTPACSDPTDRQTASSSSTTLSDHGRDEELPHDGAPGDGTPANGAGNGILEGVWVPQIPAGVMVPEIPEDALDDQVHGDETVG